MQYCFLCILQYKQPIFFKDEIEWDSINKKKIFKKKCVEFIIQLIFDFICLFEYSCFDNDLLLARFLLKHSFS